MKHTETTAPGAQRPPWKDRLARAARVVPPDDEEAAAMVRELRDRPLDLYLSDDPELLLRLQELYTPPPATFGEAAAVIDALSRETDYLDTAVELMRRFAAPIRKAKLLR